MKARLTKTRIIRSPLAIMGALVLTVGGLALGTAASGAGPEGGGMQIANTCDPSSNGPNETKTRSEILARTQKWVDIGLTYNMAGCQNDSFGQYRRDCSGLLAMAWGLEINLISDGLASSFMSYAAAGHDMYFISRAELQPGDGLVRSGHVELFSHWADPANPGTSGAYVYSFNSTGETIQNPYTVTNFGNLGLNSSADVASYHYVRYKNIVGEGPKQTAGQADVTGDGKADLVAQNAASVWVKTSSGTSFSAAAQWAGVPFHGTIANHIGDVNGDGRADLIAQNAGDAWVMTSTGTSFNSPTRWANVSFYGATANHIGDINGDGRADLIAQNAGDIWAMTSTGTSFNPPTRWANVSFHGTTANHIGDINGDGRADLIAQNAGDIWAMTSTGTSLNAPTRWASGTAFHGAIANHIEDINGDGRADLIAQNEQTVWVRTSTGTAFNAPALWASGVFYGSIANHIGDVNGDGRADLIAQNPADIWAKTSTGSAFNAATQWGSGSVPGQRRQPRMNNRGPGSPRHRTIPR